MRIQGRSLVLAVLMAACSPGPSAVTPSPSATVVIVAPNATPPPGFVPFTSTAMPYRACYPQSWQVRTDWVDVGGISGDAFIGGTPGALPDAVSFLAEPAPGYDSAQYLEVVLTNLRAVGLGTEDLGTARVNGADAELLRFARLTASGQRYTVQEAVWAQGGYGWVLSISSPPESAERAAAMIRVMLGCFRTP